MPEGRSRGDQAARKMETRTFLKADVGWDCGAPLLAWCARRGLWLCEGGERSVHERVYYKREQGSLGVNRRGKGHCM